MPPNTLLNISRDALPCPAVTWKLTGPKVEVDPIYWEAAARECPAFFKRQTTAAMDQRSDELQLGWARLEPRQRERCMLVAVPAAPDIVGWSILHRGFWDVRSPADYVAWSGAGRADAPALPASGTFLDIGANIGSQV